MFAGGMDETRHVSKCAHPCESKKEVGMGLGLALPTLLDPGMALQAVRDF